MSQFLSSSSLVARPTPPPEPALPLRLVAVSGGLGIELDRPVDTPPLTIEELAWALPGLRLPMDLSGGVRSFRHRRGTLQRLALSLDPTELAPWLEARGASIFKATPGSLRIWSLREGLGIGVHSSDAALAFDLLWIPEADNARWVVAEPRTAGALKGPSIVHVLHFCDAVFGEFYERSGRVLSFGNVAQRLTRLLLPKAGVRLPGSRDVKLGQFDFRGERIYVDAERGRADLVLPERSVRAFEFAKLVASADSLLLAGDAEQARSRYVAALEQAPRHPELCYSVASIDRDFAERNEAALGLLVESLPAVEFGLVGAELLAGVGDSGGAAMAITKQASRERYAPLAALLWVRMAELTDSAFERAGYLDQALSFSPACYAARFARFQFRASVGDLNGALADAEHLEAAASGNQARHEAILNTARHLQALGFVEPAGRLFERALRYLPKDARANLGLGEALLSAGKPERAFGLLERAIDAAGTDAEIAGRAGLLLAKLLSEHYRDLPQAIARARAVTGTSFVAVEARALEAKLREQLGDLAGAELSYARMRDTLELVQDVDVRRATLWLRDAAKLVFTKGERRAAERHLAIALRLSPRDPDVLAAYREVNLLQSGVSKAQTALERTQAAAPVAAAVVVAPAAVPAPATAPEQPPAAEVDDVELERRVEQLKGELAAQATPSVQLLEALSQGLGRLGRNSELYALLQARFEDAPPALQDTLRPQLCQVLDQLVLELAESSPEEASVYRMMRAQLGD